MKNYIQVEISTQDPIKRDVLVAQLSSIGFDGFEESATSLLAFIEEDKLDEQQLLLICNEQLVPYTVNIIAHQNWNALWESNFEPVVVDDFCAIRADFHDPVPGVEHEIVIMPKMSFGTGHHATTYLMLRQMRQIHFREKNVADFGTGTGILAIMAEKLGSKYIWAIDNEDWTVENAKENSLKNGCSMIDVQLANEFSHAQPFDIILANINRNVILDNADQLAGGLKPGGILLLSGLYMQDEPDIVNAFVSRNLRYIATVERNNWISIQFQS